jgi:hypothetical protein
MGPINRLIECRCSCVRTVFLLFIMLGVGLFLWAQQPMIGFTGSRDVTLSQDARVGSETLPAGTYRVTHVMGGSEHVMIFTHNKKAFRVKCTLENDCLGIGHQHLQLPHGLASLLSEQMKGIKVGRCRSSLRQAEDVNDMQQDQLSPEYIAQRPCPFQCCPSVLRSAF